MTRSYQLDEDLRRFLFAEDLISRPPDADPFVYVARSGLQRQDRPDGNGRADEYVGIRSYLVPVHQRDRAQSVLDFHRLNFVEGGWFDDDGRYDPGETFEEQGVTLEVIARKRVFGGLDIHYYEPSERLVVYLHLHRTDRTWIDPYTGDDVIRSGDGKIGWKPHHEFLAIRLPELKDYLAARNCGLLVARYIERQLTSTVELTGVPEPFSRRDIPNGHASWIIEADFVGRSETLYMYRAWQLLSVEPAAIATRNQEIRSSEFRDGIEFMLRNGDRVTFGSDAARYFEILSFDPQLVRSFAAGAINVVDWDCLTNFSLRYARGDSLEMCVNDQGQVQAFFGQVAKLDLPHQRMLAGFSQPMKAFPSHEFIRVYIDAQFPETMPWQWTLAEVVRDLNQAWAAHAGEAILADPVEHDLPDILGPVSNSIDELCDIALTLQHEIIVDSRLAIAKKRVDLSAEADSPKNYEASKSIGYIGLLFKRARSANDNSVLRLINQLRNAKGHKLNAEQALQEHGLERAVARQIYLVILARLCAFLEDFRAASESVLGAPIGTDNRSTTQDPWHQLKLARSYFQSLVPGLSTK